MAKFNPGDVVVLNSDSRHKMTVAHYSRLDDTTVTCQWILNGKLEYGDIPEASLKIFEKPDHQIRFGGMM